MKPSIILSLEALSNWGCSPVFKDLHRMGSLYFPFRLPFQYLVNQAQRLWARLVLPVLFLHQGSSVSSLTWGRPGEPWAWPGSLQNHCIQFFPLLQRRKWTESGLGYMDPQSLEPWDSPYEIELAKEAMLIHPHGKPGGALPLLRLFLPLGAGTNCSQRSFQIPIMQNIWVVHHIVHHI